jgi:hypothetical protein
VCNLILPYTTSYPESLINCTQYFPSVNGFSSSTGVSPLRFPTCAGSFEPPLITAKSEKELLSNLREKKSRKCEKETVELQAAA